MAASEVSSDFLKHPPLSARQLEGQELPHSAPADDGRGDRRRRSGPSHDPPRAHRAGEGEELVKRQSTMKAAPTLVEGVQILHSTSIVVGAFRYVKLAQSVPESRQTEACSRHVGQRVLTTRSSENTLFDEPPQAPASEAPEPAIDRHHALDLVARFLDFWIDELETTAAPFSHLSVEVQFRLVGDTPVDPALVEPHDLQVPKAVVDSTVDDQQPPTRDSPLPHSNYPTSQK
jgi:hypothetical protein